MTKILLVAAITGSVCATLIALVLEDALGVAATLVAAETLWIAVMGMFPELAVTSAVAPLK